MKEQLGLFEGEAVQAASIKLTGTSDDRVGQLDRGEEVFFVGKARVAGITHQDVKEVFTRIHTAPVINLLLIGREDGQRMLAEAQALANDRFGIQELLAEATDIVGNNGGEGEGESGKGDGGDGGE